MAYCESNGLVTDDVTWPGKGRCHDPNIFGVHYLDNGWRLGCNGAPCK